MSLQQIFISLYLSITIRPLSICGPLLPAHEYLPSAMCSLLFYLTLCFFYRFVFLLKLLRVVLVLAVVFAFLITAARCVMSGHSEVSASSPLSSPPPPQHNTSHHPSRFQTKHFWNIYKQIFSIIKDNRNGFGGEVFFERGNEIFC